MRARRTAKPRGIISCTAATTLLAISLLLPGNQEAFAAQPGQAQIYPFFGLPYRQITNQPSGRPDKCYVFSKTVVHLPFGLKKTEYHWNSYLIDDKGTPLQADDECAEHCEAGRLYPVNSPTHWRYSGNGGAGGGTMEAVPGPTGGPTGGDWTWLDDDADGGWLTLDTNLTDPA